MTTPKLINVFEAVKLEKLHEPADVLEQAKELAAEVSTSVAALREAVEQHPELKGIVEALEGMSSAAEQITSFTQGAQTQSNAQEAASQPAGKTFG